MNKLKDWIIDAASGPFGSNLKVDCFVEKGFPIIDGANLRGVCVTDNITKFVTEEKARSLSRSIAKRHDVIVTISGTLGQIAYIPNDSEYEEYLCSQRQFRVTFDETLVDVEYLTYYFHTNEGQKKILAFANYVGVPALSSPLPNFKNIEVDFPSIDEQHQIVKTLKDLDRKIALNRKANEVLESMAKQLYDYWFVQFDFPNAEGKPYKSSGGKMVYNETLKREIPEGWEFGNLLDISTLITGGTPSKAIDEYWVDGNIPFFGPTDCDGSMYQFTTEYKITDSGVKHSAAKIMNENCVIITARGSIGKYVITGTPMTMNQSCFAFESKEGNHEHLYFLVGQLIQHLLVKGSGSTFKSIVGIDIENSILCLGDSVTRNKFTHVVRPLLTKIKSNTQEIIRLTSLRDYLLPLLMNGQVKVS